MRIRSIKIFIYGLIWILFISNCYSCIQGSNISNGHMVNNEYDSEFVKGEFIIKFNDDIRIEGNEQYTCLFSTRFPSVNVLNEKFHVNHIERLFESNQPEDENPFLCNMFKFIAPKDADILSIVHEYMVNPYVEYAEPNYILKLCGVPNDPLFDIQWPLHNTGQTGGNPDADIDAPEAWDIETGSDEVIIAIVDSGIDYLHQDLTSNTWINEDEIPDNDIDDDGNGFIDDIKGWDFRNKDNNPMDDVNHGTACAGIVGAIGNNSVGVSGIVWNCQLMPVKTFGTDEYGSYSHIISGIEYAVENGADIISMSFGGEEDSIALRDVIDYAYSKNIVLVSSAGNNGNSNCLYPAAYDNVIAVAATNYRDMKIDASTYGEWVDVAAPGYDIYTTFPNDNYSEFSLTSSACPHVSGVAALLLSQDSSLLNEEIRKIICANVDPYNSTKYIGTGRINAYKALTRYNTQPDIPEKPSGNAKGKAGKEYTFTTLSNDSDGDRDQLFYRWNWGDGTLSDWYGPYESGDICEASHTWQQENIFNISVMAKDTEGATSDWSDPLSFSTPKNKCIFHFGLFIEKLINQFPILQYLLEHMGRY